MIVVACRFTAPTAAEPRVDAATLNPALALTAASRLSTEADPRIFVTVTVTNTGTRPLPLSVRHQPLTQVFASPLRSGNALWNPTIVSPGLLVGETNEGHLLPTLGPGESTVISGAPVSTSVLARSTGAPRRVYVTALAKLNGAVVAVPAGDLVVPK